MPTSPSTPDAINEYIQRMTACQDITMISQVHEHLLDRERTSLADVFLWRFKRTSLDVKVALKRPSFVQQKAFLLPIEERLMVLMHELQFQPTPADFGFYPVAQRWLKILTQYLNQIETMESPPQQINNPYVFGMPLSLRQEIFVGRTEISQRIQRVLVDAIHLPALLYGQRRMGKTSLLKNLGRRLPETIMFFFVDGQGIAVARDYAGLLYNMSREMIKSAKRWEVNLPKLSRETLREDPFSYFNEWLDDVEDTLVSYGYEKAVLALDEFEALDHVLDKGRFDAEDLFYMLRYLIQNRDHFEVLLAGSHTVDELPRWATYMVNVKTVKISYLKDEETCDLIERPSQNFPLQYETAAVDRVISLTRGHPHLVQLLCYEIVNLKNTQPIAQRFLATSADIEAAVPNALDKGSFFFIDIQENQITADGLKLLRALAKREEGQVTSRVYLEPLFSQNLDTVLRLLHHRDLIEMVNGGYRFQVDLIRRWFARLD